LPIENRKSRNAKSKIGNRKSSQQLARFSVPLDGTDLQAVISVTVGANDALGVRFIRAALPLLPQGR
jgi:hypothetical protein